LEAQCQNWLLRMLLLQLLGLSSQQQPLLLCLLAPLSQLAQLSQHPPLLV
jgi:hypothetical protein